MEQERLVTDTNTTLEASRCLEYGDDCAGDVEFHSVGASLKAWPRCEFHAEQRWEKYENSIERYADSSVAPSWFDPGDAGESWDDD
jgi:hypothetical protein